MHFVHLAATSRAGKCHEVVSNHFIDGVFDTAVEGIQQAWLQFIKGVRCCHDHGPLRDRVLRHVGKRESMEVV